METKDQTDKDQADKTGRTGNAAPSGAGGAGGRKPLSLQKTVESGHVRQNFSHGRSKSVVVETRKTRKLTAPGETETMAPPAPRPAPQTQQASTPAPQRAPQRDDRPQRSHKQRGDHGRQQPQLRQEERDARARALAEARRVAEVEDARRAELARNAPPPAPAPETPAPAATAAVTTETPQTEAPAPVVSAVPSAPVATPAPEAAPSSNARAPEPRSGGSRPNESRPSEARSGDRPNERHSDRGGTPRHDGPRNDGPRPDFNRGERREGGYQGRSGAPGGSSGAGQGAPGGPRPYRAPQQPQGGYNTQFMTREGGRPKNIDIPVARPPAPVDRATTVEPPKAREPRSVEVRARPEMTEDEETRVIKRGGKIIRQPVKATPEPQRERGRLTIQNAFDQDQRERSLASLKRKRERERLKAMGIQQPRDKIVREVILPEAITIQELSNRMAERGVDVIKFLMKQGAMHKITDVIDADTAELIVQDFGHTVKRVSESDVESGFIGDKDQDDNLRARAPVVTIMGHVDHGKTSLLDAIRQTNVVSGEAGGITQHIGAYQVALPSGDKITFIDTPGHAAFTAMRARGAKVTDIVVLVVAADDGVMPQTVEAINHAKAAQVPMIVAINKIDKPQADPTRVRTDLLSHDVVVESMGGDTLEVPVSALKRTNLDKLLETINLQAEVLDLKANPDRTAEGIVIEAKLERGRGPVGTVLVQRGTLHVGDIVVAGTSWGRVRALINDKGENVVEAGPSVPVEVLGFDSAPEAGDQIAVVENDARAREITDYRIRKRRETLGAAGSKSTLEQMMQQLKEAGKKDFNLLIKGDVQGSVEAIMGSLKKLATDEVEARIVHSGVGGITESDIALAGASKAVVVGFNVRANAQAKQAAEAAGIEIRYYNIIYDLLDDVKAAMSGLLAPTIREVFLGNAEVLQVFNISKVGKVAGCRVTDGKVLRGGKVRLIRDNVVIHEGSLSVLKRFKDDVKEVPVGQECGMSFANYQDLRAGDVIECFNVETITRSL